MLINELRAAREVIGDVTSLKRNSVIFLGLYNSAPFFGKIEKWLPSIEAKASTILIVDNASTDGTWNWARETLAPLLSNATVVLVRNSVNLGAWGSLLVNLDFLSSAEWVMTLHQDDEYSPNHLEEHLKIMNQASASLGMISSESRSFSPGGKELSYPRGAWLLGPDASPADIFIGHLKNHSFPFSGASFRVEMLSSIPILWHSTAFPDTEMVLRAIPRWSFHYISRATVRYLENPKSESHALSQGQRELGSFLALVRVFRSQEFSNLLRGLEALELKDFAVGVNSALRIRLTDVTLLGLIQVIAQEAILESSGLNKASAALLRPAFKDIGDFQASNTLSNLATFGEREPSIESEGSIALVQPAFRVDDSAAKRWSTRLLPTLLGALPRWLAKFLYIRALRSSHIRTTQPQWNFKWRN
jgi:glycosyltransferase involved in cell wall biosynthesis